MHILDSPELQAVSRAITDDVTRALPHALGPEKSVLSTFLKDPQEFISLAIEEGVTSEHFYLPAHQTLFAFLLDMFEKDQEIELVSLVQKLLDKGLLDRVGGPASVTDLYTYAPSAGSFRYHLQDLKDKFILRSLIQHSTTTIASAYDSPGEVAELLDQAEAAFLSIRNTTTTAKEPTTAATINEVLDDMQRRMRGDEEASGISTGFGGLENMRVTLKPGEMFVIAARPSMGKTSLMMNIVERVCIDAGNACQVFSMEMTRKQLIERLAYSRAKANPASFVKDYQSNKGELQRIQRAAMEIAQAKLFVNDMAALSIGQLRAIARRRHRESGLKLIAIDYLQLMKSMSKQAMGSREREVAEISAGLKSLAKELSIPVIVLAQLNRGPENRTGKNLGKPRMSDLRESGALEQDADMVGLLYREAYYADGDEAKAATEGRAEIVIAKNRNGPTGSAHLTFIAELMRFEDGQPAKEEDDMFQQTKPASRYDA